MTPVLVSSQSAGKPVYPSVLLRFLIKTFPRRVRPFEGGPSVEYNGRIIIQTMLRQVVPGLRLVAAARQCGAYVAPIRSVKEGQASSFGKVLVIAYASTNRFGTRGV